MTATRRHRHAARRRRQRGQPRRAVAPAGAEGLHRHGGRRRRGGARDGRRRAVRSRAARRRDAGHQRLRRPRPPARHAARRRSCRSSWSPRGPTARTSSRRSGSAPTTTSPSRSTFPVGGRADRHAARAQAGGRRPARERRALRARAAGRQRRALGLEPGHATRSTGRRAGRRCSATASAEIGRQPGRVARPRAPRRCRPACKTRSRRTWPAAAAISRASTGCCTATARSAGCCAAARRCATSEGTATRLAGSLTDITDAKVFDALTGLPNRLMFVDLLERALRRTQRRPGYAFALLVARPGRFRMVGNSLGPLIADRLLVAVAQRLQSGLRCTDVVKPEEPVFTLARLAATSSRCCSTTSPTPTDAVRIAERLRARARRAVRHRRAAGVHVGRGRHRGQHERATTARKRCCATPRPRSTARRRDADDVVRAVRSGDARARGRPAASSRPICARAVDDGAFEV